MMEDAISFFAGMAVVVFLVGVTSIICIGTIRILALIAQTF